jgi:hypothetical protein
MFKRSDTAGMESKHTISNRKLILVLLASSAVAISGFLAFNERQAVSQEENAHVSLENTNLSLDELDDEDLIEDQDRLPDAVFGDGEKREVSLKPKKSVQ